MSRFKVGDIVTGKKWKMPINFFLKIIEINADGVYVDVLIPGHSDKIIKGLWAGKLNSFKKDFRPITNMDEILYSGDGGE